MKNENLTDKQIEKRMLYIFLIVSGVGLALICLSNFIV